MTNISFINLTNLTSTGINGIPDECYNYFQNRIVYNTECIIKNICPQIHSYYVNIGISIIIISIIVIWFLNWFLIKKYKIINYNSEMWIGFASLMTLKLKFENFKFAFYSEPDTLNLIDDFYRMKFYCYFITILLKICIGFIVVVIYLNIK